MSAVSKGNSTAARLGDARIARLEQATASSPKDAIAASRGGERGAGTVLVLGIILATALALLGLMAVGDAVATKERTQDVADVAALAGAQRLRHAGKAAACDQAGDIVHRHELSLASCSVRGTHVMVTVRTTTHMITMTVESSARAGPSDEPP